MQIVIVAIKDKLIWCKRDLLIIFSVNVVSYNWSVKNFMKFCWKRFLMSDILENYWIIYFYEAIMLCNYLKHCCNWIIKCQSN